MMRLRDITKFQKWVRIPLGSD